MSRVLIIGEGWAALAALVRELRQTQDEIFWISGSAVRVIPALASIEGAESAELLEDLCAFLDLPLGDRVAGTSFVREFRNRSFREPVWCKGSELEEQRGIRSAELWSSENALVPVQEVRWEPSLVEIEEQVRERLLGHDRIRRLSGVPVEGLKIDSGRVLGVVFSSGEELLADRVIYADRWSGLGRLSGISKPISFMKGREPMGVLQLILGHVAPIRPDVNEGFFAVLNRDSGDTQDRQVVGHFYRGGLESVWSVVISSEEGEDNHQVSKRLRKIKQALEKMFGQTEWAQGDFAATVKNEQVRFEEGVLLSGGETPRIPVLLNKGAQALVGIQFVTDAYGVGPALSQVFAREQA